ncbi:MAG TPA: hypothetical protein EYP35_11180 [Desulfobacterales bacterium]|nr:hypothetical protein [Desulfobacterales bacterium]HIP39024.1 hypothetical protein [Desulfocapsa sulfexigens]
MDTEKITMGKFVFILSILMFLTLPGQPSEASEHPVSLELTDSIIKISTFYNGTTLEASGIIPADADVLLRVSGPKENVHLKVKGKVAGVLWMNKSDAELDNTPSVYMLYTPEKSSKLLETQGVDMGYSALAKGITIKPESADKAFIFAEYVKLMEEAGVYTVNKSSIHYKDVENGQKSFSATLTIPSKMNAGEYMVEAVTVENGHVLGRSEKKLTLELSGLPKVIAALAFGYPLLFGIMAVFIAVATGLIIGTLFKGGGGSH